MIHEVTPGDPVAFSAEAFNISVRAGRDYLARLNQRTVPTDKGIPPGDRILIRNDSGSDIGRFGVLGLGDILIPAETNEIEFVSRPAFSGVTPTEEHIGKWALLLQPLLAGRIGFGLVGGMQSCKIKVISETDTCAECESGRTDMPVSSSSGPAQILYMQPPEARDVSDQAWCVLRFGGISSTDRFGVVICTGPRGPDLDPAPDNETYWVADAEVTNSDDDPSSPITVYPIEFPKPTTLTYRGGDTSGTLTATTADHGVESGDSLDITWANGSRTGVVVGTISGADIPISGGSGDNLPDEDTAITYLDKTAGKEFCNWNIRLCTNDDEIPLHTHLVPIGTGVWIHSRQDKSDPVLTRYCFSVLPWFLFLLIGGWASSAGTFPSAGAATYYVDRWSQMKSVPADETVTIRDACVFDGYLYAVGDFTNMGGTTSDWQVGKWDHVNGRWVEVADAPFINANRCFVHDFGAGEVLTVIGYPAMTSLDHPVATWNGSAWALLPHIESGKQWIGYNGLIWNDDLYIVGLADTSASIKGVAKYSGGSWSAVGSGTGLGNAGAGGSDPSPEGRAIEVHDDGTGEALYVGGRLILADGATARNVAKWNGATWSDPGGGIAVSSIGAIYVLRSDGDKLYAGGVETTPTGRLIVWDGNTWCPSGDELSTYFATMKPAEITALEAYGGAIIAGGFFQLRGKAFGIGASGGAVGYVTDTPDSWESLQ